MNGAHVLLNKNLENPGIAEMMTDVLRPTVALTAFSNFGVKARASVDQDLSAQVINVSPCGLTLAIPMRHRRDVHTGTSSTSRHSMQSMLRRQNCCALSTQSSSGSVASRLHSTNVGWNCRSCHYSEKQGAIVVLPSYACPELVMSNTKISLDLNVESKGSCHTIDPV